MKLLPTHTWVKINRWTKDCLKTTYAKSESGAWSIIEDGVPMWEWIHTESSDDSTKHIVKTVTVMMPQEWQVEGRAYLSMIALPFEPEYCNIGILNKHDKAIVQEGLKS